MPLSSSSLSASSSDGVDEEEEEEEEEVEELVLVEQRSWSARFDEMEQWSLRSASSNFSAAHRSQSLLSIVGADCSLSRPARGGYAEQQV